MQLTPATLVLGGALTVMGSPAWANQQFNGQWSVEIITEMGSCNRYRYPVVIENGAVRYGGLEGLNVSGSVRPNGAVQGSISRTLARADVIGRLSGRSGAGTWTASGAVSCSGRWSAEKRS